MTFDPTLAAFRFGTGLSPHYAPPESIEAILADVAGLDLMAKEHPVPLFSNVSPNPADMVRANRARADARGTQGYDAAEAYRVQLNGQARLRKVHNLGAEVARMVDAPVGFRERLVAFWADHFTVTARNGAMAHYVTPYIEETIRPNISGRFEEMLISVVMHPMMLTYLQQGQSIGPNSTQGLRQKKGLNENLAREVLELHTLGVDGPYTQTDVTEFAELLTGLYYHRVNGFDYIPTRAEPGAETILGVTYSDDASLETVRAGLHGLARHPATSAHLANKLVVHFVSGRPDAGLVAAVTEALFDGTLFDAYAALLSHPAAWTQTRDKVRTPQEYIAAGMRALGVSGDTLASATIRHIQSNIEAPMRVMGQPWQRPIGPDGWPEDPAAWIIPQAMAGRISWAMRAPTRLLDTLPDPREFVATALGPNADAAVGFAAGAAETRADGIGVVLASAAFQRR